MTGCTDYQEGHAGVMGLPPDLENYASDLKARTKTKIVECKKTICRSNFNIGTIHTVCQ